MVCRRSDVKYFDALIGPETITMPLATLAAFRDHGRTAPTCSKIRTRLLPDRRPPMESTERRIFQAVLHIEQDSYPDGRTLAQTLERTGNRMRIERGVSGDYLVRLPTLKLTAGDRLVVRDTPKNIKEYEQALGSKLHSVAVEGSNATDAGKRESNDAQTNEEESREQLAEIVVTDDSDLAGRTRSRQSGHRYRCRRVHRCLDCRSHGRLAACGNARHLDDDDGAHDQLRVQQRCSSSRHAACLLCRAAAWSVTGTVRSRCPVRL